MQRAAISTREKGAEPKQAQKDAEVPQRPPSLAGLIAENPGAPRAALLAVEDTRKGKARTARAAETIDSPEAALSLSCSSATSSTEPSWPPESQSDCAFLDAESVGESTPAPSSPEPSLAPESESDFGFLDEVSNGESTAAPGSTSEGEGFYATTSSARWRSLCAAAADPGCRLAELPGLLAPLVAELPLRFARYAYQLAVGAPPEPDNEVMGLFQSSNPTMNRPPAPSRQRDLLPLPCASLAAEDLPREVSHTQNMKTPKTLSAFRLCGSQRSG